MFADKHRTRDTGSIGEEIAEKYLIKRGLKIVKKNFVLPFAEIDIVGTKKRSLHIVEVKSMVIGNHAMLPEDHLNKEKLRRLRRAALYIFNSNKFAQCDEVVIDLVAVTLSKPPELGTLTDVQNSCIINYYENINFDL